MAEQSTKEQKGNQVAVQISRSLERVLRECVAVAAQSYDAGLGTTESEKEGRASPAGFTIGIITALSRVLCDISMLDAYPYEDPKSQEHFLEALGKIWDLCREEAIEKRGRMQNASASNPSESKH